MLGVIENSKCNTVPAALWEYWSTLKIIKQPKSCKKYGYVPTYICFKIETRQRKDSNSKQPNKQGNRKGRSICEYGQQDNTNIITVTNYCQLFSYGKQSKRSLRFYGGTNFFLACLCLLTLLQYASFIH